MELKSLKIRHFRGIDSLDWSIGGRFICLVGPGDSTKSTILNAIELALTARRNVTFDDADFYNADTGTCIVIEATLGALPPELLSEAKFGYLIRGWNSATGLSDEPQDDDEPIITIRLSVDEALEPSWLVVNDRSPEGRRISAFDRAKLGVAQIGGYVDWQFSWAQGSALTRLMEEREDVRSILATARRQAKASLNVEELPLLRESAENAQAIGKHLGVCPASNDGFVPHLDVRSVSIGASILALHDGPVPLRQAGRGSSRLLSMGLQHEAARAGGVTLIDEIEHGLEPHRVRGLLRVLRTGADLQRPAADLTRPDDRPAPDTANQILLTTHSPVVLAELEPPDLRIVRSDKGVTSVLQPDDDLRSQFRKNPDAFLARKVIVCEGKTEIGFCRALDARWSASDLSFALLGTALADGEGNTSGPATALRFAKLGYRTAFLGDSDEPIYPAEADLRRKGVNTIVWDGSVSIEERIALDLPWEGFVEMARLAIEEYGEDHVQSKLASHFSCQASAVPIDPDAWKSLGIGESAVRRGFAKAAKAKKAEWFKRVDRAERLGEIVMHHWAAIAETPLGVGIGRIRDWVHD